MLRISRWAGIFLFVAAAVSVSGARATSFSISGQVVTANQVGVAAVTVAVYGTKLSATTNSDGKYTLSGLSSGSYTLVPSNANYTFTSPYRTLAVSYGNITGINLIATPVVTTYHIYGQVTTRTSTITVSGVSLRLTSTNTKIPAVTTTTNTTGNYVFLGVAPGTYWVTPQSTNLVFSPATLQVVIARASATGINFVASTAQGTQHIYGQVTTQSSNVNVKGIAVNLYVGTSQSVAATTTTGDAGSYGFMNVAPGTYNVAPTASGLTFAPPSRSVTVTNAYIQGVNFVASSAVVGTYTITGQISGSGISDLSGVSACLGAASAPGTCLLTATSSSAGSFAFAGVKPGSYVVSVTKTGWTFNPVSRPVTVTNANPATLQFTASAASPPATYTISGAVTATTGMNVSQIGVILLAVTSGGSTGAQIASTTTGSGGAFSFAGVKPGSYVVQPQESGVSFTPPSASVTVTTANVGQVNFTAKPFAPDFTLRTLTGGTVTLSSLRGKTVLLDFFATWCQYCWDSAPNTQAWSQSAAARSGSLVVLAIDCSEDAATVSEFMQYNQLTYAVGMDTNSAVYDLYGVTGFPSYFVIGKDGSIVYSQAGYEDSLVNAALNGLGIAGP